ncbi:efflux RND transporter periplasmic adaptor subunit [Chiayiivirga flava]|uniref:CzcB-like C-terminal circularly permuted SH3-like domain-containing protein n=1 Tax=Chiayiivirga flava TaxID=659595 RepID=A0A7W8D4U8_9GAMM|nr:HlyD family efflux transporter periplasmic adaptor subunit [Chiayiivirga flava]MBB5207944.1 hypothetical protein [Chiayiivirga flava]
MTARALCGPALCGALLLAACGNDATVTVPVEVVREAPVALRIHADGRLKSVQSTPLNVPGRNWANQQLVWMVADGSPVKKGDVVARFSPAQGELELAKALLDLERNLLARAAKQDELDAGTGRVDVDLAAVRSQLGIAQRYAGADLLMFARNEILDAIEDEKFLDDKQDKLQWQRGQSTTRGAAELGVLDSQRATFDLTAKTKREDMASLELRAPNDGVIVLESDWSGEKPKLGSTLWAGEAFATLPDTERLELEIALPQIEAQGVRAGVPVDIFPLGTPAQTVRSELTWVATAAQVRNRQSPVKYQSMKASVPADAVRTYGWVPGQAFEVVIHLHDAAAGVSVPNVALRSRAGETFVYVRQGDDFVRRDVELGARGPSRSEVVAGLAVGDAVALTPEQVAEAES